MEGRRDPGMYFHTTLYLIHNSDVAAAGVDPLEHCLQYGRAAGRQAYLAVGQSRPRSNFLSVRETGITCCQKEAVSRIGGGFSAAPGKR